MKSCVVSMVFGGEYRRIAELTFPTFEAYARRTGADFRVISERRYESRHLHYEKLQVRDLLREEYERVLYLDADIIVRGDTPSLFERVPVGFFGASNEAGAKIRILGYEQLLRETFTKFNYRNFVWDKVYFNSGVMVIDRSHLAQLTDPVVFGEDSLDEQHYWNAAVKHHRIPMIIIPQSFNCTFFWDEPRLNAYVVHYAGSASRLGYSREIPEGKDLTWLIQEDLEKWKSQGFMP